jgi:hypothetical protein
MGQTKYIGKRIELVSMDPHFHDISIALYKQEKNQRPVFLIHTYSQISGASARIDALVNAMKTLGGLESDEDGLLYFPCGDAHEQAIRRIFLDSCKADLTTTLETPPLRILDRKSGCYILAIYQNQGIYQMQGEDEEQDCDRRVMVITRGLLKLGQMESVGESNDRVAFACGQDHDALVGLLLKRAPNVRAALREVEQMATRGVLSTPASQL